MPVFPSVDWFDELRETANLEPQFRSLGNCDCKMGVKVGNDVYQITFEGFECSTVEQIDEDELRETDFFLDMPADAWKEFLENIRANEGADSNHTLNTLDLTQPEGVVRSHDELRRAAFFQYHLSVQAFFDASSHLETSFS